MPVVKLYYAPGACSIACHILLYESGIEFEAIKADMSSSGLPGDYRKINPKMRVPALAIDDHIITETPAIMTAISQLAPDKHLMGGTNLETIRVYEYANWLSGTLHGQAFGALIRPQRYTDDIEMYPSLRAKARQTIQDCFQKIDDDLTNEHAVGDRFTAIDPYVWVFWRWGVRTVGLDMQTKYPKYAKLVVKLAERDSFQKAVMVEAIDPVLPKM